MPPAAPGHGPRAWLPRWPRRCPPRRPGRSRPEPIRGCSKCRRGGRPEGGRAGPHEPCRRVLDPRAQPTGAGPVPTGADRLRRRRPGGWRHDRGRGATRGVAASVDRVAGSATGPAAAVGASALAGAAARVDRVTGGSAAGAAVGAGDEPRVPGSAVVALAGVAAGALGASALGAMSGATGGGGDAGVPRAARGGSTGAPGAAASSAAGRGRAMAGSIPDASWKACRIAASYASFPVAGLEPSRVSPPPGRADAPANGRRRIDDRRRERVTGGGHLRRRCDDGYVRDRPCRGRRGGSRVDVSSASDPWSAGPFAGEPGSRMVSVALTACTLQVQVARSSSGRARAVARFRRPVLHDGAAG